MTEGRAHPTPCADRTSNAQLRKASHNVRPRERRERVDHNRPAHTLLVIDRDFLVADGCYFSGQYGWLDVDVGGDLRVGGCYVNTHVLTDS